MILSELNDKITINILALKALILKQNKRQSKKLFGISFKG
jgi:hypothetical protein